jgi:hypothetical protein
MKFRGKMFHSAEYDSCKYLHFKNKIVQISEHLILVKMARNASLGMKCDESYIPN